MQAACCGVPFGIKDGVAVFQLTTLNTEVPGFRRILKQILLPIGRDVLQGPELAIDIIKRDDQRPIACLADISGSGHALTGKVTMVMICCWQSGVQCFCTC
ncbi:hypothetical protein D3C85_968030 [compost metagenome]